ncbi:MAG: PD-(D/E)XK nuclease family protein, partial [Candidatus Woesearchaeota archaeon]
AKNMLIISDQEKKKDKNSWKKLLKNMKDEQEIKIPEIDYDKKEDNNKEVAIEEFRDIKDKVDSSLEKLKDESYLNISSEDIKDKREIFKGKREEGGSQDWGTLIHLILEELVNNGEVTDVFIERNLEKYDFDLDKKAEVKKVINNFKKSELWKRINESENVLTEVPFKLKVNKEDELYKFIEDNMNSIEKEDIILSGVIDLVFKEDDSWVIVDYKTDRVEAESEFKLLKKAYKPQIDLYEKIWKKMSDSEMKENRIIFIKTY